MSELTCALGPDSAGTLLTGLIRQARWSIDVAMYEVGPSYAWALAAAAKRGVRVRLLLDAHAYDGNASTARTVAGAGGACRVLGHGAAAAHWKLLHADGTRTAAGSGNLVWRDAPRDARGRLPPAAPPLAGTREWWAFTDDDRVSLRLQTAFAAAWNGARQPPRSWAEAPGAPYGAVGEPSPQVPPLEESIGSRCPRLLIGGIAVGGALRGLVERTRFRALIVAPYVHAHAAGVRSLLRDVAAAQARGVDARILLGARPEHRDAAQLARLGIRARWMRAPVSTRGHAKGVVADSSVVVSSANWSSAGLGRNWESALLIRNPGAAGYFADAWHRDWASAAELGSAV